MGQRRLTRLFAAHLLVAAGGAAIFLAVTSVGGLGGQDASSAGLALSGSASTSGRSRVANRRLAGAPAPGGKGSDGGKGGKGGKGDGPIWQPRLGPFFGEPVLGVFLGILSITLSTAVLWAHQSYLSRVYGLYTSGDKELVSLQGDQDTGEEDDNFKLVHLSGAMMEPQAFVQDRVFGVMLTEGCVRLRRTVQVYQYVPNAAGKSFALQWYSGWNHPTHFPKDSVMRKNKKPEGLTVGCLTFDSSLVYLGDGWTMPKEMLEHLEAFVPASKKIKDEVLACNCAEGLLTFEKDGDWWYYSQGEEKTGVPQLGDVRVTYEIVPSMGVTVMGLQVRRDFFERVRAKVGSPEYTFLPYRLPRARWLCDSEALRRQNVVEEALKPRHQREEDIACVEPFGAMCCTCRALNHRFSKQQLQQIYYVSPVATESAQDSFANLKQELPRRPTLLLPPLCWIFECLGCLLLVNQIYGSLITWEWTSFLLNLLPVDLMGRIYLTSILLGTFWVASTVVVAHSRVSKRFTLFLVLLFVALGAVIVVAGNWAVPRYLGSDPYVFPPKPDDDGYNVTTTTLYDDDDDDDYRVLY